MLQAHKSSKRPRNQPCHQLTHERKHGEMRAVKAVVQMLRKVLVLCSRISVILMMSLLSRAETRNVMAASEKDCRCQRTVASPKC